jgi:hypothetical protein
MKAVEAGVRPEPRYPKVHRAARLGLRTCSTVHRAGPANVGRAKPIHFSAVTNVLRSVTGEGLNTVAGLLARIRCVGHDSPTYVLYDPVYGGLRN